MTHQRQRLDVWIAGTNLNCDSGQLSGSKIPANCLFFEAYVIDNHNELLPPTGAKFFRKLRTGRLKKALYSTLKKIGVVAHALELSAPSFCVVRATGLGSIAKW